MYQVVCEFYKINYGSAWAPMRTHIFIVIVFKAEIAIFFVF